VRGPHFSWRGRFLLCEGRVLSVGGESLGEGRIL
jgi:hypothetical protein